MRSLPPRWRNRLPPAVVAILLVAAEAVLTGALHFDGLADTADGFGGGHTRDDVLRIMRDHAIGSYGGVALILTIALKIAAWVSLLGTPVALITIPVLGRWSILPLTATLPYARSSPSVIDGMGGGMGRLSLFWGSCLTVLVLFATKTAAVWIAAVAVVSVSVIFGWYCRRRIGGITGDTLGANLQLCECAAMLVFVRAVLAGYMTRAL